MIMVKDIAVGRKWFLLLLLAKSRSKGSFGLWHLFTLLMYENTDMDVYHIM